MGLSPKQLAQAKPGAIMHFEHTAKGTFIAKVLAIYPADEGDLEDNALLEVAIPTADGSGQERIVGSKFYHKHMDAGDGRFFLQKRHVPVHVVRLRPSKITAINSQPNKEDVARVAFSWQENDEFETQKPVVVVPAPVRPGEPQIEIPIGPPPVVPRPQARGKFKTILRRIMRKD